MAYPMKVDKNTYLENELKLSCNDEYSNIKISIGQIKQYFEVHFHVFTEGPSFSIEKDFLK